MIFFFKPINLQISNRLGKHWRLVLCSCTNSFLYLEIYQKDFFDVEDVFSIYYVLSNSMIEKVNIVHLKIRLTIKEGMNRIYLR